jgi:hypothetical protein
MASQKNNYELVLKAKIITAPIPTLPHSPHPVPEKRRE